MTQTPTGRSVLSDTEVQNLRGGSAEPGGVVIAYFGGRPWLAMRTVTIDFERPAKTLPEELWEADRVAQWITEKVQIVSCDCGAVDVLSRPPQGGPTAAVSYARTAEDSNLGKNHLTIVRTAAPQPPCEHWYEIDLPLLTGAPTETLPAAEKRGAQTPSVGRIVHYQHGTGPFSEQAAIVTAVLPDGTVNLVMFISGVGALPVLDARGEPASVRYSADPAPGHWNWPPRV
ncbi:hypothetical protein [Nocardia sp. NPDC049149]|uniref:hypothetical protein n=1 Tax=Nocardia sp. NPDC049149 TaxID=3364315 RepID=UPI003714C859